MKQLPKFRTVADINAFNVGRMILVRDGHEWAGEETDFIVMCNADGKPANSADKPSPQLLMKVRTKYGTELLLKGRYVFMIEEKIVQQPNKN